MKKFTLNHKILISMLVILLILIIWFFMSAERLNIPRDNIEAIETFCDNRPLYFTDKNVIDDTVDMLNSFMLKPSSRSQLKGGNSPTTTISIQYKNGDEKSYGIYNEGIIYEVDKKFSSGKKGTTMTWYKKYGWGFLSYEVDKFFGERKHLAIPHPDLLKNQEDK